MGLHTNIAITVGSPGTWNCHCRLQSPCASLVTFQWSTWLEVWDQSWLVDLLSFTQRGGFLKWGYLQTIFFLIGFSSINNPFWVPPFSGNTNLVTLLVLTQDVSIRDIIAWHPRLLVVSPFWTADFRALLLRYPFLSLKTGLQPLFVVESVCFLSLFDYSWMISLC